MNEWMNTCIYIAPVKQKSSEALAAEQMTFEFTDIRQGVFPGGPKNWAKSTRFRTWKIFNQKTLYNGEAHE